MTTNEGLIAIGRVHDLGSRRLRSFCVVGQRSIQCEPVTAADEEALAEIDGAWVRQQARELTKSESRESRRRIEGLSDAGDRSGMRLERRRVAVLREQTRRELRGRGGLVGFLNDLTTTEPDFTRAKAFLIMSLGVLEQDRIEAERELARS